MTSIYLKILWRSQGPQVYCSLLKRGMKTLYFQQSSRRSSSWQMSQTWIIPSGVKDLRRPSRSVRNLSFISGEKYWSLTLQYLKKNLQNSLGQRSQMCSSIQLYIFFQNYALLQFNFFMRQYTGMWSFFLIRKNCWLTCSRALLIHGCEFQSCASCPFTSDSQRSPSIIQLYSRYSILSKPNRISLGVSRFQWIRDESSTKSSLFFGLQRCLSLKGMVIGNEMGFLVTRLGGRM